MYDVLRTLQRGARHMWIAFVVVLAVVLVMAVAALIGGNVPTAGP